VKLGLTDLIDVQILQQMQDGFAEYTGLSSLTTDENGVPVTEGSRFSSFCRDQVRQSDLGCQRCEECDKAGALQALETGKAAVYQCHAGLVDFAAPIMVEGRVIGSFLGGQIRTEEVDEGKMRKIAEELSLDPDSYVEAAKKAPYLEREQVDKAAEFLMVITKVLSEMAYQNYATLQKSQRLERAARSQASYIMTMTTSLEEDMRQWGPLTERALESQNAEEMEKALQQLQVMTQEAISDFEDALDYIRLSAGEIILSESEYNINDLVTRVIDSVDESIKEKNIEVEYKISEDVPCDLLGDSGRIGMILSKVVQSILLNAKERLVLEISSEKNSYSTWLVISLNSFGLALSDSNIQQMNKLLEQSDEIGFVSGDEDSMGASVLSLLINQLSGTLSISGDANNEMVITIRLPQLDAGGES